MRARATLRRALLIGACLAGPAAGAEGVPVETPFFAPTAGARQACSGCHGMNGAGNREGARAMPPIRWRALSRPTAHRPAYDAAGFARALSSGQDPAGRQLSALMPRYDLSPGSIAALVALLARLDDPRSQGVFPDRLVFATILPEGQARRPHHDRSAWLIQRRFAEINASGGLYGRKLQLATFAGDEDFIAKAGREPVLAVLLDYGPDRAGAAARRMAAEGIPDLFPIRPLAAGDDERRVRGFTASEGDVATALVEAIAGPLGARAVSVLGGQASSPARRAAEAALRSRPAELVADPAELAARDDAAILLLDRSRAPPCGSHSLIVAGSIDVLAGLDGPRARACNWRLVFGDPRFQPDPEGENAAQLRRLLSGADVLDTDRAAFVAAELAVRAATAAGRAVDRRSLVEALARLGTVETGIWPVLDFRRNPAAGTRTVRIGDASGRIALDLDAGHPPSETASKGHDAP